MLISPLQIVKASFFTMTFSHFSSINLAITASRDCCAPQGPRGSAMSASGYTVGSLELFKGTKALSGPGLLRLNASEPALSKNKIDIEQEKGGYK